MQNFISEVVYELKFFCTDVAPTAVVFIAVAVGITAVFISLFYLLAYLLA